MERIYTRREWTLLLASLPAAAGKIPDLKNSADIARFERGRVLRLSQGFLREQPLTITAKPYDHSPGGPHDYYSEGDYNWPKPEDPNGPHVVHLDGMTNPRQFKEHRRALMRFSVQAPALVAAWMLTRKKRYAEHAAKHYRAWFVDAATRMNPNLQYSQATPGVNSGTRGGVIDGVHFVEVARALRCFQESQVFSTDDVSTIHQWFKSYLEWLTTSQFGRWEGSSGNNHAACWVMQVAEFALLTGNGSLVQDCRLRLRRLLEPMSPDGGWKLELSRTKPYCYSLFQMDAFATACQQLSTPADNLFALELPGGQSVARAMSFIYPYIKDKSRWPYPPDVMWFDLWPVRHPCLLFAGLALKRREYVELWTQLNPDPQAEEAIRNYPVRQPVLWFNHV